MKRGWPIIGHSLLLSGPDPQHITLSHLADKSGPIFSIRLGTRRGLIISSWEAAKECYKTNDVALSNRQRTASMGLMGYNYAILVFSNYGAYWRAMRKVLVQKLLSNSKVDALGEAREAQTRAMMRECAENKDRVDMRKVFADMSLGLMCATVAGERDSAGREGWRETLRDFFDLLTVFTMSDFLPCLKWLDRFGGMHEAFKRTGRKIDGMLQAWLEEHKKRRGEERQEDDFMTEIMSVADSLALQFPSYDADTISKATCQTLMVGGTDTSSVTLTWALSLLLNNRHTLERAQAELDLHVGRERLVQESDIEKLVYIQAVVKETLRLQPPITLTPREAKEDCVVAGYHVPKGTWLFVNTWKIQRTHVFGATLWNSSQRGFSLLTRRLMFMGFIMSCFHLEVVEEFVLQFLSPYERFILLLPHFFMVSM
ncbi:hypothetical protein ACS0TY_021932 [Phlomoides rotata]